MMTIRNYDFMIDDLGAVPVTPVLSVLHLPVDFLPFYFPISCSSCLVTSGLRELWLMDRMDDIPPLWDLAFVYFGRWIPLFF